MPTEQQKLFVEAYLGVAKGDEREAMKIAGYSEQTDPGAIFGSRGVTELIADKMPQYMMRYSPKAMYTILDIMNGENLLGAKERFAAAKDWLDRNGFKSAEKVEVKSENPLFILPAKKSTGDD